MGNQGTEGIGLQLGAIYISLQLFYSELCPFFYPPPIIQRSPFTATGRDYLVYNMPLSCFMFLCVGKQDAIYSFSNIEC